MGIELVYSLVCIAKYVLIILLCKKLTFFLGVGVFGFGSNLARLIIVGWSQLSENKDVQNKRINHTVCLDKQFSKQCEYVKPTYQRTPQNNIECTIVILF